MSELFDDLYFFFRTRGYSTGKKPIKQSGSYECYCYRSEKEVGAFIPCEGISDFHESFSNVILETAELDIGDDILHGYKLRCMNVKNGDEIGPFTVLCTSFLDVEGGHREKLISDPYGWCDTWRNLLGNKDYEAGAYPVLAELLLLEELVAKGYEVSWVGPNRSVSDVITTNPIVLRFEVKSTISREINAVRMSEEFQVNEADYLCFYRFERISDDSQHLKKSDPRFLTVENTISRLVKHGLNEGDLRGSLLKVGLTDTRELHQVYCLLESHKYRVDDHFPDISKYFVDGKKPDRINNISYTLDLSGIDECEIPAVNKGV